MNFVHTVFSENFFRRFGNIFEPYLSSVGIDACVLERADVEIPEERYIALWEATGQTSPNIGLELGSQIEADDLGALGHAICCAPSVEKALETLQQFIVVFAQKTRIDFGFDSRQVVVEYQIDDPTIVQRRQDAEFGLASILRLLALITDNVIKPMRVDFEHQRLIDTSVHKRLFRCQVYFNQPTNRLYLPADVLKLPVSKGNQRLYSALEPYLQREREERSAPDELLPRITRMIAADLSRGVPSLAAISEQLCVSRRTLQRRLNQQNIEFSSLVEDVRRELAMAYIKNAKYSVTEVSILLGYAESGSFSRAFRRWTGQAPQQYRSSNAS